MENKNRSSLYTMDSFNDYYTVLILAFVVFSVFFWSPNTTEQEGGHKSRVHKRGRYGRRDRFGYYGDYWNVFNPWRINNPCANYAARKCKGNYYYEPCYESKYFKCMNSTFYA